MKFIIVGDLKNALWHVETLMDAGRDAESILFDLAELGNNLLLAKVGHYECPAEIETIPAHRLADLSQTLADAKAEMHGKTNKRIPLLTAIIHGISDLHDADTEEVLKVLHQMQSEVKQQ